jgi:hypothetical protein
MKAIRVRKSEEDLPWLLPQWGPCTTDPLSGEYFRDVPMSPTQMKEGRIVVMSLPPLCSKVKLDCCSYAMRRVGSGVLGFLNASSLLRLAFGNWKDSAEVVRSGSQMPDNYTENKLQISFASKFLVAESIRKTILKVGSANFEWGEIAGQVKEVNNILEQTRGLHSDITLDHRVSDFKKAGLSLAVNADQLLDLPPSPRKSPATVVEEGNLKTCEFASDEIWELKKEEGEIKNDPDASSTSGSEADLAESLALSDFFEYSNKDMVSGASSSSFIHTVDNSKIVQDGCVGTGCNARPRRDGAHFGKAANLRSMSRRFCPRCTSSWPLDVIRKLDE